MSKARSLFLYTTEKEDREAGCTFIGFDLSAAKEEKLARALSNKYSAYRRYIVENNFNWISIHTKSRGKYKYSVCADCVEGFCQPGYAFTPSSSQKAESHLKGVLHKTKCWFCTESGNAVIYARFTTMEDAETFAELLATLEVYNRQSRAV